LYIPIATPPAGKSKILRMTGSPPPVGVKVIVKDPAPGTTKSVAAYWSA
jgi:hypothetical protein